MMVNELSVEVRLVTEICCVCGIPFAMSDAFRAARRLDHALFYCPAGHAQGFFGATTTEKERDEYRESLRIAKEELAVTRRERQQLEDAVLDKTNELKALKKRVSAGVCPHCRRTFQDLARHCASKHPGELRQGEKPKEEE